MIDSKEMQIGKAGEYLVCADLILKGFVAYPSEQGLPYDVILDIKGKLYKVQVKTTETYKIIPQRNVESKAYIFNIKRKGKGGKKRYTSDEIDIFALVCLDTMKVGYIRNKDMPTTINLRVDGLRGDYHDEKGKQDMEKCRELYKQGMTRNEISETLGLHISSVYRYLNNNYSPFTTTARYFNDIVRDRKWFYEL